MRSLTEKQRKCKDWIEEYIATHRGVSPTMAEIAQGLGVEPASASYLALELVRRGHATHLPRCWRTLQLIEDPKPSRRRNYDSHARETA